MLNIAVIDATTAAIDYYVERQAGCASEYYTGSGEARGQWIGRGATALGLAGGIDDDAFRRLMSGVSPDGAVRLARPVLRVHPRDDPANPVQGVFNTRSSDRPNPIGLHRVRVLERDGVRLHVSPIEALDGTPIVDVKPPLRGVGER